MTFVTFVLFKSQRSSYDVYFYTSQLLSNQIPENNVRKRPKISEDSPNISRFPAIIWLILFASKIYELAVHLFQEFTHHLEDDPNMFEGVWRYRSLSEYIDIFRLHQVNGEIKKTAQFGHRLEMPGHSCFGANEGDNECNDILLRFRFEQTGRNIHT